MIAVKCDTCKISGAYAHLDCQCKTSTVGDIGNRHSMQVTHSYKERIFHILPQANLWMIWHHKLKLPLSAKYNWFQWMVIRVEQCAKFQAIPSIMHGTPQFDPFHQFKIGQEWCVERRKIPRLPGSLDHYSAPHYSDAIMSAMASEITGVLIVYSTVCSDADQRTHQSSASMVCVRGIHRWPVNSPQSPVNSPHKSQLHGTCSHLMTSLWKQEIQM